MKLSIHNLENFKKDIIESELNGLEQKLLITLTNNQNISLSVDEIGIYGETKMLDYSFINKLINNDKKAKAEYLTLIEKSVEYCFKPKFVSSIENRIVTYFHSHLFKNRLFNGVSIALISFGGTNIDFDVEADEK